MKFVVCLCVTVVSRKLLFFFSHVKFFFQASSLSSSKRSCFWDNSNFSFFLVLRGWAFKKKKQPQTEIFKKEQNFFQARARNKRCSSRKKNQVAVRHRKQKHWENRNTHKEKKSGGWNKVGIPLARCWTKSPRKVKNLCR